MHSPRRSQITIGRLMALIAACAVVLTLPHLQTVTEFKVVACALASLPLLVVGNALVEVLFGIPCPGCRRWSLRRLVSNRSYFSCSACGMRFKRFGLGPWLDASGSEDDLKYRGKSRARICTEFTVPRDPGGTTSGDLLRNKRLRERAGEEAREDHSEGDVLGASACSTIRGATEATGSGPSPTTRRVSPVTTSGGPAAAKL